MHKRFLFPLGLLPLLTAYCWVGKIVQATCHLLTNVGTYYSSADSEYELREDEYNETDLREFLDNEDVEIDGGISDRHSHESEAETSAGGRSSFHIRAPKSLYGIVDGKYLI